MSPSGATWAHFLPNPALRMGTETPSTERPSLPGGPAFPWGRSLQLRSGVGMLRLRLRLWAAALVGNEPQAAPLPGVWPWRCFSPRQKRRWLWFCPACYGASFSRLLLSPGESQRRQTSLSVELDYETGQERGAETRLLENLVPRVLGAGPQPWKSPCVSYLPALTVPAFPAELCARTHWHTLIGTGCVPITPHLMSQSCLPAPALARPGATRPPLVPAGPPLRRVGCVHGMVGWE